MTKRLKITIWLLCLVLGLSACKPAISSTDQTPTPVPTQSRPTVTPIAGTPESTRMPEISVDLQKLDGLQITFLHPWSADTGRTMDLLVDEFNQTNEWGIHVLVREPGSLSSAIEDLENPEPKEEVVDLTALPINELANQDQNRQKVVDLNPYVYSDLFGFKAEQIGDFFPVFWNGNLLAGKLYGIPAQETASVLFYNTTWAAELGFSSAPKTGEAFRMQNCAANQTFRADTDRSNDGVGGWIVNTNSGAMISWLNVLSALDPTKPVESFSSPETEKVFLYLFDLQKDACAWDSRLPEPYDYFATRQALTYSGTIQDILPQTAAFERSENTDEWQVIAYPSISDSGVITEGLSYAVFESNAENQLAAWLFIRWISQPINQARLLQTSGSLPLGTSVLEHMQDFEEQYPQWKAAQSLLSELIALPVQANNGIVHTVLEDAATFLFKPEFTAEKIPGVLEELDATIQELSNRE